MLLNIVIKKYYNLFTEQMERSRVIPSELRHDVVHERGLLLEGVVLDAVGLQLGGQVLQELHGHVVLEHGLADRSNPAVNKLNHPPFTRQNELFVLV